MKWYNEEDMKLLINYEISKKAEWAVIEGTYLLKILKRLAEYMDYKDKSNHKPTENTPPCKNEKYPPLHRISSTE